MKQLKIMMLAAIVSFCGVTMFTSCSNDDNPVTPPDLTHIIQEEPFFNENKTLTVNNGWPTLTYICRIGNDFDSALDSLIRKYEPLFTTMATEGHYSGQGLIIDKQKINDVDFSYDSREFILLTFIDKANIYNILMAGDVIDEKGNYFTINWPED